MRPRHGARRGWRLAVATAAAVAAAGALPSVASGAAPPAPAPDAETVGMCPPRQQHPAEARRLRHPGDLWGPYGQVPADRRRQSGRRWASVAQFWRAWLQGLSRLRGRRHESSGLRRDVAGVQVPLLQLRRDPLLREESPTPQSFGLGTDFNPGTVAGSTSSKLQPAGGIVVPATPEPSSASGCSASDFAGFVAGNIALIQRGTCTFAEKVANAEAAGRLGGCHLQRGQPRTYQPVQRVPRRDEHIPVIFTSYAVGTQLLGQYVPARARF
jgi:hypothetical protein